MRANLLLPVLLSIPLASCLTPGTLPPLDHAPLLRAKAATSLTPAVANDTIGGVPVALAWCRPCGSVILYRRDTPKGTLTLSASGRLQDGDQILQDKETGTFWKQLTGQPVESPLADRASSSSLCPWC